MWPWRSSRLEGVYAWPTRVKNGQSENDIVIRQHEANRKLKSYHLLKQSFKVLAQYIQISSHVEASETVEIRRIDSTRGRLHIDEMAYQMNTILTEIRLSHLSTSPAIMQLLYTSI